MNNWKSLPVDPTKICLSKVFDGVWADPIFMWIQLEKSTEAGVFRIVLGGADELLVCSEP